VLVGTEETANPGELFVREEALALPGRLVVGNDQDSWVGVSAVNDATQAAEVEIQFLHIYNYAMQDEEIQALAAGVSNCNSRLHRETAGLEAAYYLHASKSSTVADVLGRQRPMRVVGGTFQQAPNSCTPAAMHALAPSPNGDPAAAGAAAAQKKQEHLEALYQAAVAKEKALLLQLQKQQQQQQQQLIAPRELGALLLAQFHPSPPSPPSSSPSPSLSPSPSPSPSPSRAQQLSSLPTKYPTWATRRPTTASPTTFTTAAPTAAVSVSPSQAPPTDTCEFNCPATVTSSSEVVCGSDGISYPSFCKLREQICKTDGKVFFYGQGVCASNEEIDKAVQDYLQKLEAKGITLSPSPGSR